MNVNASIVETVFDYPEPDCGTCEDYGFCYTYDPSTDGITGTYPCPEVACQERAERNAARLEAERHAKVEAEAAHGFCSDYRCCPPF